MSRGWIPAHRKLFDPGHWMAPTKKDPASRIHAWLDLCQMAQHETYAHAGQRLNRGEVLASLRWLADRWCWSLGRVQRFMDRCKIDTQIDTVRDTPSGTVYRIVKYDTYAGQQDSERYTERDTMRNTSDTDAIQEQQCTMENSVSYETAGASDPVMSLLRSAAGQAQDGWAQAHPSAQQVVAWWVELRDGDVARGDLAKQGAVAKRIAEKHTHSEIVRAMVGMSQTFPHSKGEAWDLFDLERKFQKAYTNFGQHPSVQRLKFEMEMSA